MLGNVVIFPRSACWHVCYTPGQGNRRKGNREIWAQERAERIEWIEAALCNSKTEVRPNDHDPDNRLNYLLIVEAAPDNHKPLEYYCVVAEIVDDRTVEFVTGFPISRETFMKYRRAGRALYTVAQKKKETE